MKKLLTICLLIATTIIANAQTKPTKEETIAYIDKVLNMSNGYKTISDIDNVHTLTNTVFKYDKVDLHIKIYRGNSGPSCNKIQSSTNIKWETLSKFEEAKDERMDTLMEYCFVIFDTKVRYDVVSHFVNNTSEDGLSDEMHYPNSITLYVLKTKAESLKKALLRLAVIAKEENKDPFDK